MDERAILILKLIEPLQYQNLEQGILSKFKINDSISLGYSSKYELLILNYVNFSWPKLWNYRISTKVIYMRLTDAITSEGCKLKLK